LRGCDQQAFKSLKSPYKPEGKSAPPLFLEDEKIFQNSARMVAPEIAVEVQPREPNFEKYSQHRERGGVPIQLYLRNLATAVLVQVYRHIQLYPDRIVILLLYNPKQNIFS
jgi:hypothetical protein